MRAPDLVISPEAKGLFRFSGCILSLSISLKSFSMYTIDATLLNAKKPAITFRQISASESKPLNTIGKNNNKFFIQCFILIKRKYFCISITLLSHFKKQLVLPYICYPLCPKYWPPRIFRLLLVPLIRHRLRKDSS